MSYIVGIYCMQTNISFGQGNLYSLHFKSLMLAIKYSQQHKDYRLLLSTLRPPDDVLEGGSNNYLNREALQSNGPSPIKLNANGSVQIIIVKNVKSGQSFLLNGQVI